MDHPRPDSFLIAPLPKLLRVPLMRPYWGGEELGALMGAVAGRVDPTPDLLSAAKEIFDIKYAHALDFGRSALNVGLQALNLESGAEVIVQSNSCRAVIQAILSAGLSPVLCDIDHNFNIDPLSVERSISPRTKAIIMVHMLGRMAEAEKLEQLAAAHGLYLIDDAAVAAGASVGGRMAGTFGEFGFISFNKAKNIIGAGGGILLTNSDQVNARIGRSRPEAAPTKKVLLTMFDFFMSEWLKQLAAPLAPLRNRIKGDTTRSMIEAYRKYDGIPDEFENNIVLPERYVQGETSRTFFVPRRMHPFQAAMGLTQLRKLKRINRIAPKNAAIFNRELSGIASLVLPEGGPPEHVYTVYPVFVENGERYQLSRYLSRKGIETRWSYFPVYLQHRFRHLHKKEMPMTGRLWHKILYLPVGPHLKERQIRYVADMVKKYYSRN